VALDVMLWDWDGYAMNKNNWRLYHDMDKDRMVFMPHGMDQMFWKPGGSILPPMQGLVAKGVLEIPSLRARYFERMRDLRASVFKPERMTNRIHQINAKFAAVLQQQYPDMAKGQATAVADLCDAIVRRGQSLDDQLARPIELPRFDNAGWAVLSGWEAKPDFGSPLLVKSSDQGHEHLLQLGTASGSSIGSWRTKLWLEQGRYRLEGRIKTEGVVSDPGDPRAGAGFRLARQRPDKYVLGTSDWHSVNYEFSVDDPLGEAQIVCEFRGAEGKAWFDADSLRLARVKP
jgi:hypothetical protein